MGEGVGGEGGEGGEEGELGWWEGRGLDCSGDVL